MVVGPRTRGFLAEEEVDAAAVVDLLVLSEGVLTKKAAFPPPRAGIAGRKKSGVSPSVEQDPGAPPQRKRYRNRTRAASVFRQYAPVAGRVMDPSEKLPWATSGRPDGAAPGPGAPRSDLAPSFAKLLRVLGSRLGKAYWTCYGLVVHPHF